MIKKRKFKYINKGIKKRLRYVVFPIRSCLTLISYQELIKSLDQVSYKN